MSVINKMLRDLDHRHAGDSPLSTATVSPLQRGMRNGTASVSSRTSQDDKEPEPRVPTRWWVFMGLVVLLVNVAAAAWLWFYDDIHGVPPPAAKTEPVRVASASTTPVVLASPASAPMPDAIASAPVLEAAPAVNAELPTPAAPVARAPEAAASESTITPTQLPVAAPISQSSVMVLRMEQGLSARRALDALLSTPVPSPSPEPSPASAAVRTTLDRYRGPMLVPKLAPTTVPAVAPVVASATVAVAASDSTPSAQRQQQAGGDALAQAQSLWNGGSRDAAMDLMQQSIAAAERTAKASANPVGNPLLISLVREMARMQLAEARYGAVWEMLTRLESSVRNQPDLWAIRANAAQRLGRHQDSVRAYTMALQMRPDEQRWMLGAAVSLAALGQISSAADMLEKARAIGPVNKDILAYLRQAGVSLKE